MRSIEPDRDSAHYYRRGGDPDRQSGRLYRWHQTLYSRPVPGVSPLHLDVTSRSGHGLVLRAAGGTEFILGSDGIIPT